MSNTYIQNDAKKLWDSVLSELELTLSGGTYNSWLTKTNAKALTQEGLLIACQSTIVKSWVTGKLKGLIQDTVDRKNGKHIEIKYIVEKFEPITHKIPEIAEAPLLQTVQEQNTQMHTNQNTGLSKKYTLENFLIGKNNQLAYAVATAATDNPGKSYNPVFIYSGVGLGKTHLIQAIGNKILENKPSLKVLYTTGEAFTNELIELVQTGKARGKYTSNKFREKYRSVDVLLIDDVQFIIGKETTQEELFHTINTLTMEEKQIVLTSDRPPQEFTKLPARITSRFASGMTVDIQTPDMEMRSAILRRKRDLNKDTVSNEVIDFIAENMPTNVRELEGAYIQLVAKAKSIPITNITIETAKNILSDVMRIDFKKPVNMNHILKNVCTYYSLKSTDIKGKRRTKDLVIPRQVAMYLMYEITKTPFMTIGDFLGGRDHTTILHGVRKVGEQIQQEQEIKQQIESIKNLIYTSA